MKSDIRFIRNFSIVAHVDHGKSTLADQLIKRCGGLTESQMQDQVLDSMPLEREKGITIKAQTVRLHYSDEQGNKYQLNLIDTPGHADFAYEVSRSMAACEGSILLVDVTQGVQAQTLATIYQAIEHRHDVLPVINKVDLQPENAAAIEKEIEDVVGIDTSNAVHVSARTGQGVEQLLTAIICHLPPPAPPTTEQLKALIIDSWYDQYLGVVALVRVFSGKLQVGAQIRMMASGLSYIAEKVGFFTPRKNFTTALYAGEIGFLIAKIKTVADCKVGDTIVDAKDQITAPMPGFKQQKPAVFCGLFPPEKGMFPQLKDALEKLSLNDASIKFEQRSSSTLGLGFYCGFLGLLHLEIAQERLSREFNMAVLMTAPSVSYRVKLRNGEVVEVYDPAALPEASHIAHIEEPWVRTTVITPAQYLGPIMEFCSAKRGSFINRAYSGNRVVLTYRMPLNEIVFTFCDRIKALSKGFASFDWEMDGYEPGELVKLDILVNGERVDALCTMLNRHNAEKKGRELCERLRDLIPRHLFQIPIQAAIGGRIIARETIVPLRKDVTAKCYGGDVTRKRKLLEKQKAGKKRMQTIGNVNIPQSVFIEALRIS